LELTSYVNLKTMKGVEIFWKVLINKNIFLFYSINNAFKIKNIISSNIQRYEKKLDRTLVNIIWINVNFIDYLRNEIL
jgi:hypothetical protein